MSTDRGARDASAFEAFVVGHHGRLVRLARHLHALAAEDAEDLVQDALVRLATRWHAVDEPFAYALRCIANAQVDRQRRWLRWTAAEPALIDQERARGSTEIAESVSTRVMVLSAIHQLPDLPRQVIVLRYLIDLTEVEVARLLDRPLGSVKSAAHRGMRLLHEQLAEPSMKGATE